MQPLASTLVAVLVPFSVAAAASLPEDPAWGGFRGANGSGTAPAAALPAKLDVAAHLRWKAPVPKGYSSPVLAAGRLFTTGHERIAPPKVEGAVDPAAPKPPDRHKVFTVALDAESGKELWRAEVEFEGKRPGGNSFAAPTPATDGARVYALFHHVGMIAYDLDGKELWRNPLGAPYNIPHGLATSPLVVDGAVVLQLDQDGGSALVCLDAATGKERWRTAREGALHSYSTPALYRPKSGGPQVIVSGSYEVASYALETGAKLWWVTGTAWQSKAVPQFFEDLCIVSSYMPSSTEFKVPTLNQTYAEALAERDTDKSGTLERKEWDHEVMQQTWFIWDLDGDEALSEKEYDYLRSTQSAMGGLYAIDLEVEGKPLAGDVTATHMAWQIDGRRALSDVVSPVLVDGKLFLLKDPGIMTVVDARTGEVGKSERIGDDEFYASPVAAGGRVLLASLSGQLSLLSGAAEWEVLTTAALDDVVGKVWSTPALAYGRVYVRSEGEVYCFGEQGT